jgi:hypothetical protein
MRTSAEQSAARTATLSALGRLLHEIWEEEETGPLPERITGLLAQLDGPGTSPSSGAASGADAQEVSSSASAVAKKP